MRGVANVAHVKLSHSALYNRSALDGEGVRGLDDMLKLVGAMQLPNVG